MIKEIKYFLFIIIIFSFIFLTGKFYFSDTNLKKSHRSRADIDQKVDLYSQDIDILENNTKNIIEFVDNAQTKKKKFFFWELINKDE
jgi:hypothetical protein